MPDRPASTARRTRTVLVVGERHTELSDALVEAGFDPVTADPVEIANDPDAVGRPDVALLAASLGLPRVALLSRLLREAGAAGVAVYADGDLGALETCVRAGFEYVAPPYSPVLLRSRLVSAWERGRLTTRGERLAADESRREYERDLFVAHELQAGFLPDALPQPPGWELAARCRPARMVSGDFYDGFELLDGRRLGFVVADVCDKGIGAGLFMALIRTLLRHSAEHTPASRVADGGPDLPPRLAFGAGPLVQAVVDTNRYLAANHLRQGYFATVFFGVLDPLSGGLVYINCGHNPPVVLRADGGTTTLPPTGPALGMLPDGEYRLGRVFLNPGDSLFVYTDGVVEAADARGDRFGTRAMLDALAPDRSARDLLDGVDDAVRRHVDGAEQSDDITTLGLRRLPAGPLR
ncbi:PP2C family protein-serine/threonine phosphatase [Saccharothrix obliqua]|uniref:PP2C family protein-serine/threonine phosphatase n=1 Tax=Saccharothrix obliqua TaxID=2861747 RepID=UPI001C5D29CB|nr:PP2C family protein-serine/threonine phosphatase [Saccharothrix obliqua]MBW4717746.1 PP2C family protein-serine/threonine phosphatase [Saccharothrix obliqua]